MKRWYAAAMLAAVLAAGSAQGDPLTKSGTVITQGKHICLRTDRILGRTILDDSTIVFRMDDDTYWKNRLQAPCVDLAIRDGFSFATRDEYICSDEQRIRVLGEGTICFLGAFSRTVAPAKGH